MERLTAAVALLALLPIGPRGWTRAQAAVEDLNFNLQWSVPSACPSREQAHARLQALLRHTPANDAWARVTIHQTASDFELRLETHSGQTRGERRVRHPRCGDLVEAALAIVAWTLDAEETQVAPARLDPTASAQHDQHDPGAAEPEPSPGFDARVLASSGELGVPELGLGIGATARPWPHVGLRATLAWWFERSEPARSTSNAQRQSNAGAELQLSTFSVGGCWSTDPQSRQWALCPLAEAGLFRATGTGELSPARTADVLWLGAGVELEFALVEQKHWGIPLRVGVVVPLRRARFVLDDAASTHVLLETVPALRLGLGLEIR